MTTLQIHFRKYILLLPKRQINILSLMHRNNMYDGSRILACRDSKHGKILCELLLTRHRLSELLFVSILNCTHISNVGNAMNH